MSPPVGSYQKSSANFDPAVLAAVDEFADANGWTRSHTLNHLLPLGLKAAASGPAPTLSTSGAAYVADDAQVGLALQAGHVVAVTPGTVTVQARGDDGSGGAVVFDLDRGRLAVTIPATGQRAELELTGPDLGSQIEGLVQSIGEVRRRASTGPIEGQVIGTRMGAVDWIGASPDGSGITVSGITVRVASPLVLYVLLSELAALMGRWLRRQTARVADLQQALAATPEPVEAAR
jgi:hypothetical protein